MSASLWPRDRAAPRSALRLESLAGQTVAVWGAARTGKAAANLLVRLGARPVLSDKRPVSELDLDGLSPEVRVEGGGNTLAGARWLIPSPGIRPGAEVWRGVNGVTLISEIELALAVSKAPMVAITGTDGKSTTTLMCGEAIKAAGRPVVVAGNIGDPLCDHVESVGADGVVVAEVSAFQLWSCGHFRPRVSVITNVAEDHGDYFEHDRGAYALAKSRVLWDQGSGDVAILRADDAAVWSMAVAEGSRREAFAPGPRQEGWGLDDGWLTCDARPVMAMADIPVPGTHNAVNALAALAAGRALGLPLEGLVKGIEGYEGLPHRLQRVAEIDGVTWFDDSKATNPHAAAVGLRSLPGPVVAIVGGFDKGLDHALLEAALVEQARGVICMGPAGARVAASLGGRLPVRSVETMGEAVALARGLAEVGDQVVLAPGASSFDRYRSYAHRGEVYQSEVLSLLP